MMKLGEAAYNSDSSNTGEESSSETSEGVTAEDVVDAEFEEIDNGNDEDEEDMKKAN